LGLLDRVLRAGGGLDLWRRMRRFTVHMSIRGALIASRCPGVKLPEFVAEGDTREPALEIIGFTALDLRALYRPDWTALERPPDGVRLHERGAAPKELTRQLQSATWDYLQLAHYCGGLIWSYLTTPFVLAEPDFECEELKSMKVHGQRWRRLKVLYPARLATHAREQTLYFDGQGLLRRLDTSAVHADRTRVAHIFAGHQRYSGILVPTMSRVLTIEASGALVDKPPLLDVEIFEAQFK
jgi:hypothetical protein